MITAHQAANKWNVSVRYVQTLCKNGRIPGAIKFGTNWTIPSDAIRPTDGRQHHVTDVPVPIDTNIHLIRKSPFLDMTDLYRTPGTADDVVRSLEQYPVSQALFSAEIAYSRGEIDKVYEQTKFFLQNKDDFFTIISGGMLLGLVAMWKGDVNLWQKSKMHLYEAPWKSAIDRDIISLSIASVDLSIRNTRDFPDWFYRGRFDNLPTDSHPAARIFYVKYLLVMAQELAAGKLKFDDVSGLGLMRSIPFIMEPMISQAVADNMIIVEIYLRMLSSIVYLQIGEEKYATEHLDRAISLCLPDKLYGPLVEHRRQLGLFLDQRLILADAEAARRVKELHKTLHEGWVKLHNSVMNNNISARLSDREREVVRLAAFGLRDSEIALQLHISKASVKSMIQMARNKTGIKNRSEFGAYI